MAMGMKIKSVSEEDLPQIIKQMVNGALEDTDQVTKLYQAIHEEWYFKKMANLKNLEHEMIKTNSVDLEQENISATVLHTKRKSKVKRHVVQSEQIPEAYNDRQDAGKINNATGISTESTVRKVDENRAKNNMKEPDENSVKNNGNCGDHVNPENEKNSEEYKDCEDYESQGNEEMQEQRRLAPRKKYVKLHNSVSSTSLIELEEVPSTYSRYLMSLNLDDKRNKEDTMDFSPTVEDTSDATQYSPSEKSSEKTLYQADSEKTIDSWTTENDDEGMILNSRDNLIYKKATEDSSKDQNDKSDKNDEKDNEYQENPKEIIEVWNNIPQSMKANEKYENKNEKKPKRIKLHNKESKTSHANEKALSELTFESWKKKKTALYKQQLQGEERRRQQELHRRLMEMERKRVAHESYARARREYNSVFQQRCKLSKKGKMMEQESLKKQIEERRMMNEKAFKEWKKQKDIQARERRMLMMAYANQFYYQEQCESPKKETIEAPNVEFDSWLNQLDWVLHEKYLKERRYLVRSFYCQPAYYGDATMYYNI